MKTSGKEIKIEVCTEHRDMYLKDKFPDFVFNDYFSFPARACVVGSCNNEAYYSLIGIQIPDTISPDTVRQTKNFRPNYELFREAKVIMDDRAAIESLTGYLWARIVPTSHREFEGNKLLRKFAQIILKKLKIDPDCILSDKDMHRILQELQVYPPDIK